LSHGQLVTITFSDQSQQMFS